MEHSSRNSTAQSPAKQITAAIVKISNDFSLQVSQIPEVQEVTLSHINDESLAFAGPDLWKDFNTFTEAAYDKLRFSCVPEINNNFVQLIVKILKKKKRFGNSVSF